jgi:Choline/Carnitine o-acyltransferase
MWLALTYMTQHPLVPNAYFSNSTQSNMKIGDRDERPLMTSKPPSMRSSGSTNSLPEGYKADPKQGAMLRYQASLPHLPVPPLASTLAKYLETIRPHLTPSEYAHSESVVRAFGTSAQAAELQRRLEARAAAAAEPGGMANWLADWWNETAYMAYRDPVVVNVSYFYVHVTDAVIRDAPRRAATLLKAMLPFRTLVETCVKHFGKRFCVPCVLIPNAIVVSALSWNLRRSAARRSAWTRTSGCECICMFTITRDASLIYSPRPDSMPVDIPLYLRTLPTNSIMQHTTM